MYPIFIGFWEVTFVLLIAIVVFGPKKIPEIARGLGQGIRAMREATDDIKKEIMDTADQTNITKEIKENTKAIESQIQETKSDIENSLGSVKRNF